MFDDVMLRFPIFFRSLKMQLPRSLQEKYKVTENEIGGRLWKSFIISRSHVFEAILNKKCVIDIMYLTNFTPVVFPGGIIIGATVAKTTGTFSSFTNSNNTGQNLNLVLLFVYNKSGLPVNLPFFLGICELDRKPV